MATVMSHPAVELLRAKLLVEPEPAQALARLDGLSTRDAGIERVRNLLRAQALEGLVDLVAARAIYADLLATDPRDAAALIRLAALARRTGDIRKAENLLERARLARIDHPELLFELIAVKKHLHLDGEAEAALLALLAVDDSTGSWSARAAPLFP